MKRRLFVKPHEGVKCEPDNEQLDAKGTRAVVARLGCDHCRDTDIHRIARKPIELRARTASFKWQVSPLLLYSLPWHRARTEPSRKVSCQSASCRATLFGGSREKCFAFRSRSVDGTEYVTYTSNPTFLIGGRPSTHDPLTSPAASSNATLPSPRLRMFHPNTFR